VAKIRLYLLAKFSFSFDDCRIHLFLSCLHHRLLTRCINEVSCHPALSHPRTFQKPLHRGVIHRAAIKRLSHSLVLKRVCGTEASVEPVVYHALVSCHICCIKYSSSTAYALGLLFFLYSDRARVCAFSRIGCGYR
jgi:hypothetical protein